MAGFNLTNLLHIGVVLLLTRASQRIPVNLLLLRNGHQSEEGEDADHVMLIK